MGDLVSHMLLPNRAGETEHEKIHLRERIRQLEDENALLKSKLCTLENQLKRGDKTPYYDG